jgi:hypothetical protein
MTDPKTFASLSPTLLARKGGARPAMRPQMLPLTQAVDDQASEDADDLGWNDMGHDGDAHFHSAEIVPILPEVLRQQEALADRMVGPAKAPRPRRSALSDGRRAAFTLRVDAERHLKLRLACTLNNRSAQQLVTDALDQLLDGLPEVASLAAQVGLTAQARKKH